MYDLVREAPLSKVANQENNARKKCKCKSDVILTGTLSKDVYIPRIYADVHCFATQKTIHVWFEWKKSPPCWWMCKMFFFPQKKKDNNQLSFFFEYDMHCFATQKTFKKIWHCRYEKKVKVNFKFGSHNNEKGFNLF